MRTVLVVDDNRDIADAIANATELSFGYEVLTARDGAEALRVLGERPVDLVVLDYHMPGVSGFDVLRRLGETAVGAKPPPVIVCSQDEDAREESIRLGAVAFVLKWHGVDVLLPLIRQHAGV